MTRRATNIVAGLALTAVIGGWWLFEAQSPAEVSRSVPTVLTGATVLLVAPALAACRRRPTDPVPAALATGALVVTVGYFRLLSPPWFAVIGAAASYLTAAALLQIVAARSRHRGRLLPAWALWGVSLALTGAIVAVSAPTVAGDRGTRASTWAVLEWLPSGRLHVERQANPAALWPDADAATVLWLVWVAWTVGLSVVAGVRWWRAGDRDRDGALALAAAATGLAAGALTSWPEDVAAIITVPTVVLDRWYTDIVVLAPALAAAVVGLTALWAEIVTPQLAHSPDGRVRLEPTTTPDEVRRQLADLLADPTARLFFPTGDTPGDWVDDAGHATSLALPTGRGATIVTRSGSRVAAIEHDSALAAQPDLVDIAATATSLSIEQRSRRASAEREAADVRDSARRLLVAAERSRDELRHRIREGPDHRLAEVLELVEEPEPLLPAVHDGLRAALDELRTIAHGEYPLSLQEHGLAAAVIDLAATSGTSITLDHSTGSPPSPERETLYLVIASAASGATHPLTCVLSHDDHGWRLEIDGAGSNRDVRLEDRLSTLEATVRRSGDTLVCVLPASDDPEPGP